ncbi:hypothetical protein GCM10009117_03320 [Gangjinia marincola]|uniref:Uncharacterized protein n=1 Tax=Gangjinia marincola TaxID=578463 RepID=A0ABN1MDK7_9FLAO
MKKFRDGIGVKDNRISINSKTQNPYKSFTLLKISTGTNSPSLWEGWNFVEIPGWAKNSGMRRDGFKISGWTKTMKK